jgi:succinate dehydrogenase / fumarate reductase cytochrome b subunit
MYQRKFGLLGNYTNEIGLNPNVGTWSWLLHRISGIVLSLYIFAHILVLSSSIGGSESFNKWIGTVQNPVFHVLEIALIGAVAFHLLNGLRITITDFFFITKAHKTLFWIAFVIFLVVIIATAIVFVPRALHHTVEGGANVIS